MDKLFLIYKNVDVYASPLLSSPKILKKFFLNPEYRETANLFSVMYVYCV